MTHVAAFGQMNLDVLFGDFGEMPRLGEEVPAGSFDLQLGGGPMLYPILLERLGIPTKLGTFLGKSTVSWIARKLLDDIGYSHYTDFYNGNPGQPIVITSVLSYNDDRSFISYNEGFGETQLPDGQVYDFLKGAKAAFAPHGKTKVLKRLHQDGVKLLFDTGWYDDLSVDKYRETLGFVDIFTPNDKEALKMTGKDNLKDALHELAELVRHPIISLGADGCITWQDGKVIQVPMPVKFDAVDTTGAGDNFLAGVMYGLYNDWDIIRCMEAGNVLGGYSTTALGCYKANISLEEMKRLMACY